jgi:voltage-gated potassium channel
MLSRTARTELYSKYDKASQLPLLILALLMIPLLLLPEMMELTPEQSNFVDASDWFIYSCFAADFAIKIYLAPSAMGHIKRNWLDVIILLLPLLRPLRILQGTRMLRLVRALRLLSFAAEGFKKLQGILARRRLNLVLLITLMVVILCAGLVYAFEKSEGGGITSFGDALWWALATVTTVGYGDVVPRTAEGRGIALFLMLAGITFYSILTANVAAYFVESNQDDSRAELEGKLDLVLERLSELEAALKTGERMEGESTNVSTLSGSNER